MARVADFLLRDPRAPLTLSIGELAERAGTSAATVTRFCRMIGYSGYVALRVGIATDVGRSTTLQLVDHRDRPVRSGPTTPPRSC